jgi:hypothetical protein
MAESGIFKLFAETVADIEVMSSSANSKTKKPYWLAARG